MAKKTKNNGQSTPESSDQEKSGTSSNYDALPDTVHLKRDEVIEDGGPDPGLLGRLLVLAASLFGLWVSFRVTNRHLDLKYGEALEDALCQAGETFNCDNVLNSDYAAIGGMPISLPQAANFLVILLWLVVTFVGAKRMRQAATSYIFGMGLLSVLVSVFMFYIAKSQIGSLCPYCMMLYGANLAVLVGGWWAAGGGLGLNIKRLLASLAVAPLLLGSAALWGAGVAAGNQVYNKTKAEYIAQTLARQEAQAKERASLEAKGLKFPTIDADDPIYGNPNAEVTLIEFADFECGYCKRLSYELHQVKEQYGDNVRFVFKNYPMNTDCNPYVKNNLHPYACAASMAGECANKQGKFWEFHDLVFKNNHRLRDEDLRYYAEEVGLDMAQYDSCLSDPATKSAVKKDMDDAKRLEISGTPRTYIAGEELRGALPAEIIAAKLSAALGEAKARVDRDQDALEAARAQAAKAPTEVNVSVGGLNFGIDAFEAAIDDSGKAVSASGREPDNQISWFKAKAACEAAGKRLCTQQEWMTACTGAVPVDDDGDGKFDDDYIEGWEYPYGEAYMRNFCWTQGDLEKQGPARSGLFAQCKTPTGIYDLTGNVAEWVGETPATAVLMGGGFAFEDKAKCVKLQDTYGAGWANRYTGFRCCQ